MKRNLELSVLIIALSYLLGPNVYADMYIESVATNYAMGKKMGKAENQKTYLTADKMKTIQGDSKITIIRLDKGLMWSINLTGNTYTEMTFEGLKESVQQAMKFMEDAMAKMSPEERKQAEQFMPQFSMPKKAEIAEIKVEKTGRKKDVSGYTCQLMIITSDTTRTEVWVTDQTKYDQDAKKMLEKMGSIFSDLPTLQEKASMYQTLIKIGGFPIEMKITTTMGPSSFSSITTATLVEHKKINDSEFELPKGLNKVKMPSMP